MSGLPDFESGWIDRIELDVGEIVVPFMGRATLIANRRASGRLRDLADVEALGETP